MRRSMLKRIVIMGTSTVLGLSTFQVANADDGVDAINYENFGKAPGILSIAIGHDANAGNDENDFGSIALGSDAKVFGPTSIGIGPRIRLSESTGLIALGAGAFISGTPSEHVRKEIKKNDDGTYEVTTTEASKESLIRRFGTEYGSITIGLKASAHGLLSTTLGAFTTATADYSIAVGADSIAGAERAVSLGHYSYSEGEGSLALGSYADALADNSVALGADSVADERDTVSIGSKGHERRIVNVREGINDTDAVNVAQLKKLEVYTDKTGNRVFVGADGNVYKEGDLANTIYVEGKFYNKNELANTTVINGKRYDKEALNDVVSVGDAFFNESDLEDKEVVGDKIYEKSALENAIKFTDSEGNISFYASDQVEKQGGVNVPKGDATPIADVTATLTKVSVSESQIQPQSLTAVDKSSVINQLKGVDGKVDAPVKLGNVADGKVEKDSKEAVNGGQLFALEQKIGGGSEKFSALDQRINKVSDDVKGSGASAAAIAGLHPLAFNSKQKGQVMAAVGNYRGKRAVALGGAYYATPDLLISAGMTLDNHSMMNIGVSYRFGSSSDKMGMPYDYSNTLQQLKSDNDNMKKQIEELKKDKKKTDKEIEELKGMILELSQRK